MTADVYQVVRHLNAEQFLNRAEDWLLEREAQYNLLLGIARRLTESVDEYEAPILLATVESATGVEGCVFRTPPHKLGLTSMPFDAVPAVVRAVADLYRELPAVLGPEPVVGAFARAWAGVRAVHWIPGMRQRIYKLERLRALGRNVSGSMKMATPEDLPVTMAWIESFSKETGVRTQHAREMAELLIDLESLVLWNDGEPKSMAGTQGFTDHGVRISYVYTPPEFRGNGYASALVHELSRKMLDAGRKFCVLYADASNPTSNAIYAAMGYFPIEDVRDYNFIPAKSPHDAENLDALKPE